MIRRRGFAGLGDASSDALLAITGMYVQPGIASAYPDLASQLLQIYKDRASQLRFLPSDWYSRVSYAQQTDPTQGVLLPMPTHNLIGFQTSGIPAWLTDPAAAQAWDAFRATVMQAYQAYAAGQSDLGRQVLAEAYANTDFWNTLYAIDSVIALPVTATGNALTAAANSAASSISTPVWILGGAVLLIWLFKSR
jgi:hypothetical protein